MPRLSDPRRLPRRNHYQEGPGFLFLATQGGRPPQSGQVVRSAQVVRRRRAALRRWENGEAIAAICAEVGCSRAACIAGEIATEPRVSPACSTATAPVVGGSCPRSSSS